MSKSDLFAEYRDAVAELAAARVAVARLEEQVSDLEVRLTKSAPQEARHVDDVPERLRATLGIIKTLGGKAQFGKIVAKSKLTGPGTLAQIRVLIEMGLVKKIDRGFYGLA